MSEVYKKPAIYDQHQAAFARVSAYVILDKNSERVATIAFKFPADGAGRIYAYVHWFGIEMVRGQASGYGYDKRSAAVVNAVNRPELLKSFNTAICGNRADDTAFHDGFHAFRAALASDGGEYWDNKLAKAGFIVLQAV